MMMIMVMVVLELVIVMMMSDDDGDGGDDDGVKRYDFVNKVFVVLNILFCLFEKV